jgi:hypothetical protein
MIDNSTRKKVFGVMEELWLLHFSISAAAVESDARSS